MATALDIIKLAMKAAGVIGVGQTPNAEDTNDSFRLLNMMLAQWNRRRPLIYHLRDVSKVATGAVSYTVGTGGDFNVARPERLESAYVRLLNNSPPNQVDYPLQVIEAYEDYADIVMKQFAGFPQIAFLDTAYPLGNLYVWPVPNSSYEIHLVLKVPLSAFATLEDEITFPPEYEEAILYNLAGRLMVNFKTPMDPALVALARASLTTLQNANTQLERMGMPSDLVSTGVYNIYSDRYVR